MKRILLVSLIAWGVVGHTSMHAEAAAVTHAVQEAYEADVAAGKEAVLDEIRAIIYHNDGSEIVLTSDIKPHLDGTPRTLRDIVLERLQVVKARAYNISFSEEDVERFLEDIQKRSRLSKRDLERLMEEHGFTYEEGKEDLRCRKMIEQLMEVFVGNDPRLKIASYDVEAADAANPAYTQPEYLLCQAVISDDEDFESMTADELAALDWEEPFLVTQEELAEDRQFIQQEPEGAIVDSEYVEEGIQLTKLMKKTPSRRLTLEERYDALATQLYMDRFAEVIRDYHADLLENAVLRFTYDDDRLAVMEGEDSK